MAEDEIARRSFLKGAGAVATALTGTLAAPAEAKTAHKAPAPAAEHAPATSPSPAREPLLTLTAAEAAFLSAAYDAFIPADKLSPSGTDCGLVAFMDRQLAGAWGAARGSIAAGLSSKVSASRAISFL